MRPVENVECRFSIMTHFYVAGAERCRYTYPFACLSFCVVCCVVYFFLFFLSLNFFFIERIGSQIAGNGNTTQQMNNLSRSLIILLLSYLIILSSSTYWQRQQLFKRAENMFLLLHYLFELKIKQTQRNGWAQTQNTENRKKCHMRILSSNEIL